MTSTSIRVSVGGACAATFLGAFADGLPAQDDQVAAGKLLFEETAGDVGCASCHGMDAKGDAGPDIRGRTADDIHYAKENVEDMNFLELTDQDIEAVAAYLATFQ